VRLILIQFIWSVDQFERRSEVLIRVINLTHFKQCNIKNADTNLSAHRTMIVSTNRYECVGLFYLLSAMTIEPLLHALDEPSTAHLLTK
jgi:hypothetical protein